jgi:hypothetical protein
MIRRYLLVPTIFFFCFSVLHASDEKLVNTPPKPPRNTTAAWLTLRCEQWKAGTAATAAATTGMIVAGTTVPVVAPYAGPVILAGAIGLAVTSPITAYCMIRSQTPLEDMSEETRNSFRYAQNIKNTSIEAVQVIMTTGQMIEAGKATYKSVSESPLFASKPIEHETLQPHNIIAEQRQNNQPLSKGAEPTPSSSLSSLSPTSQSSVFNESNPFHNRIPLRIQPGQQSTLSLGTSEPSERFFPYSPEYYAELNKQDMSHWSHTQTPEVSPCVAPPAVSNLARNTLTVETLTIRVDEKAELPTWGTAQANPAVVVAPIVTKVAERLAINGAAAFVQVITGKGQSEWEQEFLDREKARYNGLHPKIELDSVEDPSGSVMYKKVDDPLSASTSSIPAVTTTTTVIREQDSVPGGTVYIHPSDIALPIHLNLTQPILSSAAPAQYSAEQASLYAQEGALLFPINEDQSKPFSFDFKNGYVNLSGETKNHTVRGSIDTAGAINFVRDMYTLMTAPSSQQKLLDIKNKRKVWTHNKVRVDARGNVHASTHAEEGALKCMVIRAESLVGDPKAGAHAQALLCQLELKEHAEAMIQKNGVHNSVQDIKNAESSTHCLETYNYNLDLITGTSAPEMPWGVRPRGRDNVRRSAHYEYTQLEKRSAEISQLRDQYNKDVAKLSSNSAESQKRYTELSDANSEWQRISPALQKMQKEGIARLNVIHEYSPGGTTLIKSEFFDSVQSSNTQSRKTDIPCKEISSVELPSKELVPKAEVKAPEATFPTTDYAPLTQNTFVKQVVEHAPTIPMPIVREAPKVVSQSYLQQISSFAKSFGNMTLPASWPAAPRMGDLDAFAREKKKQKQSLDKELDSKSSGGSSGGPKKDDDKNPGKELAKAALAKKTAEELKKRAEEEAKNGIYNGVGYHHNQSRGQKSPAPINGQQALNNSIKIKETSPARIAMEGDKFVVLDQTRGAMGNSPAEFHGHVRAWNELEAEMRVALQKVGWVNWKGKILK